MTEPASADRPTGQGVADETADRVERWVVPVISRIRRVLRWPLGLGLVALTLAVLAALAAGGLDEDGVALGAVALVLIGVPMAGVWLFSRAMRGLEGLPATVRAAPENAGEIKGELADAGAELGRLRTAGVLGLPGALGWLRRTLGSFDQMGGQEVRAALLALHPVRLGIVVLLCLACAVAVPVAMLALLAAWLA